MIVIFGGAFNPPTLAHLEIYHHVQKNLAPERFIFLPVSSLYTKRSLASNQHRFQMLKIMTSGIANIDVSTLELDDSDYLGTYQSLIRFQEHFPEQEVVFLIGADNLPKLHKWINAKSLLSEFRFVVVNRSSNNLHESIENDTFLQEYQDRFIILPSFNSEMSSTKFRDTFNKQLVHPEVYAYIQAHGLYRG